jgi:hypothetical protein
MLCVISAISAAFPAPLIIGCIPPVLVAELSRALHQGMTLIFRG